jgi:hypothetical protein
MYWIIYVPIIVIVVAGVFKVLSSATEASKRKKEKTVTDPDLLTPRKITRSFTVSNADIDKVLDSLGSYDPRISSRNESSFIAYIGDASSSKFNGVLFTDPAEMPMRIIGQKKEGHIEIHLDEDYGFQMFVGPAKSAYINNYEEGFRLLENILKK